MSNTQENNELRIRGEFTMDPQVCRFVANQPILENKSVVYESADEGMDSPIVNALFSVPGVSRVEFRNDHVLVRKSTEEPWPKLAGDLLPKLRDALVSETPPFSHDALAVINSQPAEKEMSRVVEDVLERYINPAIASHGGFVKLKKIENNNVYIEMGGGCQGCSASQITMKNGVEKAIRDALPQVNEIIDVTDHDAGENPFYT